MRSPPAVKERFRQDGLKALDLSPQDTTAVFAREVSVANKLVSELTLPKQSGRVAP